MVSERRPGPLVGAGLGVAGARGDAAEPQLLALREVPHDADWEAGCVLVCACVRACVWQTIRGEGDEIPSR